MAKITKEKILDIASDMISDSAAFESLGDNDWLHAVLFYNTGINDLARHLIRVLEEDT